MPVAPDPASRAVVVVPLDGAVGIREFANVPPPPPQASNADIARDFLDLAFQLESGTRLPAFSRFEGAVSVRLTGTVPPSLSRDLDRLVQRLRREAGIDIARTAETGRADITINAVSRATIRRHLPLAACFVIPNVSTLDEYRAARRDPATRWTQVTRRERVAIFLPADVSPQEMRDCLHEELAQALGPLNDLYRLPDSVFNDDNIHTVLTGYDMLILRAFYDPALHSGMSRDQVAARLPGILSRINPQGDGLPMRALAPTPPVWAAAVQEALGPGADPAARRRAAMRALAIAADLGWQDHRRGFSHFIAGRTLQSTDPQGALAQFDAADRVFAADPATALHRAYVTAQRAAQAVGTSDPDRALALLGPAIDTARAHQNAALLATLMLVQAEALDLSGRTAAADTARMDSLGWARYGFGPDWAVRARQRGIGAPNPTNGSRSGT